MLFNEIGDKHIPSGMFGWSGEQLFQAVEQRKIGAYHVSLWVLNKFNQAAEVKWMEGVIQSGTNRGESLLLCK